MPSPAPFRLRDAIPATEIIEGERKTVTALFADIKGSMELMEDLGRVCGRHPNEQRLSRRTGQGATEQRRRRERVGIRPLVEFHAARPMLAIVERLVRIQLGARGCERLDVGIRRAAVSEMILRQGQGAVEIEKSIIWLRDQNAKGAHIHVHPTGLYGRGKLNVVLYSAN